MKFVTNSKEKEQRSMRNVGKKRLSLGNEMNRTRFRYLPRSSDVSLAIENRIVTRSPRVMLRFSLTFRFHFPSRAILNIFPFHSSTL